MSKTIVIGIELVDEKNIPKEILQMINDYGTKVI
jgi:hypothetical protein